MLHVCVTSLYESPILGRIREARHLHDQTGAVSLGEVGRAGQGRR